MKENKRRTEMGKMQQTNQAEFLLLKSLRKKVLSDFFLHITNKEVKIVIICGNFSRLLS